MRAPGNSTGNQTACKEVGQVTAMVTNVGVVGVDMGSWCLDGRERWLLLAQAGGGDVEY